VTRFPNIDVPVVSITITQSGAAPSELETQVTKRVEDAVANLTGVKNVISTVTDGRSVTAIEFRLEVNVDRAINDVEDAIAKIRADLPRGVDEPVVEGQARFVHRAAPRGEDARPGDGEAVGPHPERAHERHVLAPPPALDPAVFAEIASEIGEEGARQVLTTFLADSPARIDRLREGAATGRTLAVEHEAHTLKGAAGTLGLLRLADLARRLEEEARAGRTGDFDALVTALSAALDELSGTFDQRDAAA